jgi:hypothetical protein
MSDNDNSKSAVRKAIDKWFGFPKPDENHDDNIWADFHIFDGEWIHIQNRREWYESPNVPGVYADHKNIMKQNMGMGRPEENFFKQNIDDGSFASEMHAIEELPSGRGEVKIVTNIGTKNAPSGENDFCMVEYVVDTYITYDIPNGVTFLPRIFSRPINRFFKWAFLMHIGEEMVEYDGEYARERTTEYMQYVRKYHGEEPTQTKTRQAVYKPSFEDGIFFQ